MPRGLIRTSRTTTRHSSEESSQHTRTGRDASGQKTKATARGPLCVRSMLTLCHSARPLFVLRVPRGRIKDMCKGDPRLFMPPVDANDIKQVRGRTARMSWRDAESAGMAAHAVLLLVSLAVRRA